MVVIISDLLSGNSLFNIYQPFFALLDFVSQRSQIFCCTSSLATVKALKSCILHIFVKLIL